MDGPPMTLAYLAARQDDLRHGRRIDRKPRLTLGPVALPREEQPTWESRDLTGGSILAATLHAPQRIYPPTPLPGPLTIQQRAWIRGEKWRDPAAMPLTGERLYRAAGHPSMAELRRDWIDAAIRYEEAEATEVWLVAMRRRFQK